MKVGDLVKLKDPNHPAGFPYMKETGVVVEWEFNHPIIFFPSVTKAILINQLEVISESR